MLSSICNGIQWIYKYVVETDLHFKILWSLWELANREVNKILPENVENLSAMSVLEATSKASLPYFPYHKYVCVAAENVLSSMQGT